MKIKTSKYGWEVQAWDTNQGLILASEMDNAAWFFPGRKVKDARQIHVLWSNREEGQLYRRHWPYPVRDIKGAFGELIKI